MTIASQKSDRWIVISILILAGVVFTTILLYARKTGMLCFDDAYITFRYAENLASGKGFVYNAGEHILGTTTPFFCLLLAGLRMIGIKTPVGADLINLFSAIFSSILIFLLGREVKNRIAGLNASILFICFPYFWLNLPSGMETMFAIFLALVLVWLDLKERPVLAGLVAGLLLLTRIDALALLAGVALMRFFQNRRQTIIIVSVCLLTLLPWLIFSEMYFGGIIPQSLLAKKLIHAYRAKIVFQRYTYWFLGLRDAGTGWQVLLPALIGFSFFAGLGVVQAFRKERWALIFFLWIVFFVVGMTAGQVTPFPWYRIPMLSGYLILTGLGIQWLSQIVFSKKSNFALALNYFLVIILSVWFMPESHPTKFSRVTNKERVNLEMVKLIKSEAKNGDKVLAGEVGIVGYELMAQYIIDSSGLVSERVYELRKEDKLNQLKISREYKWDWWGTMDWVKHIIAEYNPEFIISELRYLHLKELIYDPEFERDYKPIGMDNSTPNIIVVFQKKKMIR